MRAYATSSRSRRPWSRSPFVFLFATVLAWLPASALGPPTEYEIEAAHVYNFAKYLEYPTETFASPTKPFLIGIIGTGPLSDAVQRVLAGEQVQGHPIAFKHYTEAVNARGCQIVLLLSGNTADSVTALHGSSAFTMTQGEGECKRGSMVSLFVFENRVRFEANLSEIRAAQLKLGSSVLALAKTVVGK